MQFESDAVRPRRSCAKRIQRAQLPPIGATEQKVASLVPCPLPLHGDEHPGRIRALPDQKRGPALADEPIRSERDRHNDMRLSMTVRRNGIVGERVRERTARLFAD